MLFRSQVIVQAQTQLYQAVSGMVQAGTLTPEIYHKIKKPYEETLYILGIKDADAYLPSDKEVAEMVKQAEQAKSNKQPSPDDQKKLADANLANIRAKEIEADMVGETADKQLEGYSLLAEHKARAYA